MILEGEVNMGKSNGIELPLISVLMGIYNCEGTLEEAVKCIMDQTYKNWELILCDDCSTDGTLKIAKKLAEKDHRIKVIQNDRNLTLAPTLNRCLSVARGEYVARMDGDDICSVDRFEKELDFLMEHPEYALVSCNMELFDKEGTYRTITYLERPLKQDFVKKSQFCHAGCMMRIEVIRQLDGYSESENRQRVEDYDLWIRMYAHGFSGYNLPEVLYSMRDDRNAFHRRTWKNRINEAKLKVEICRKFDLSMKHYIWSIIPIIKWIIPTRLYRMLHRGA